MRLNPKLAPPKQEPEPMSRADTIGLFSVLGLFLFIMVGIYGIPGITGALFTPTEAAGIGASGAFFIALLRRSLTFKRLTDTLVSAVRTTAMLFFLVIGAVLFSNFINLAGLPDALRDMVLGMDLSPVLVILAIVGIYVLLGCVLESMSMILLTVPVFYPLVQAMGFDLIWFGILVVVVTEISLITPPVGLNVFVLKTVLPDVKLSTIFRGVTPFWIADIVRLVLIATVPAISLALPNMVG
mgnify:CR=1 FL=1